MFFILVVLFFLTPNVLAIHFPIKIAFYNSTGTGDFNEFLIKTMSAGVTKKFGANSFTITNITETEVKKLSQSDYDAIIFPGGSGTAQANAIGEDGIEEVRTFVKNGGGFIGTCGGAFLAMGHILLYGPGPDGNGPHIQMNWGEGPVKMDFTKSGLSALDLSYDVNQNFTIQYYSGPIVKDVDFPDDVMIWAHFQSDVKKVNNNRNLNFEKNPSAKILNGKMVGTVAISGRKYGSGRVVLNSPHAELIPNYPDIYGGELVWVLQ